MTSARKRRGMVVETPAEHNVGKCGHRIMKTTKRTTGQHRKTTGKADNFLVENDENYSPSTLAVAQNPDRGTCQMETSTKLPVLDLYPGKILLPSAKIKLQLFPIDEGTRMGLEKDGFHPYLELTLSTRKKISSVLKHLNSKWGSSSVTVGEPMLCPYDTVENLATYRWTVNDNDICAGDVYAAVGNPTVFRLRYGWFSNFKAETISASTSIESCLKAEGIQKSCGTNVEETNGEVKQIETTRVELKSIIECEATSVGLADKMSFDRPIGSTDNEVRTDSSFGQRSLLWDDSLTNISIGGLLSEASLQGKLNSEMKSNGSNAGLQPSQLICDSFDAFLAAQMNHPQGPRPAPQESRSSILDAEDTCHAFAFQKFSSSGRDKLALHGDTSTKSCSQDADAEKFKFPNGTEANVQSEISQNHTSQKYEKDQLFFPRLLNDESSLGLSGIKWTDSLGPFDLGLSSSRSGFVN